VGLVGLGEQGVGVRKVHLDGLLLDELGLLLLEFDSWSAPDALQKLPSAG
jgi:hypothetical protein